MRKWKDSWTPPLFGPDSSWKAPSFEELPSWQEAKRVGLDIETRDDNLKELGIGVRRGGYITGVSFAIEGGPKYYLPTRHEGGGNLDPDKVLAYLRNEISMFQGDIVGANLSYDIDYLMHQNIDFSHLGLRDIQVAEPLLNENRFSYSLDSLAKLYGLEGKNEDLLKEAAAAYHIDPKKEMWKLPAKFVGAYAESDADLPLKILRNQERLIESEGLSNIYELERKITPICIDMRRRGVAIDFDHLDRVEIWTLQEEKKLLDDLFLRTNVRIGIDEINQKKLTSAALDAAGLPYDKTPTGEPKIDTELLLPLAKDNKVASAILHIKYINKLRNTFVKSIRTHQTNGRVHTTFNQLKRQDDNSEDPQGAGPGRFSSTKPNLQQQPGRRPRWWKLDVPIEIFWRKIYLPDEGGQWGAFDYSGQEPKLFTHFAAKCGAPGSMHAVEQLRAGGDFHDITTSLAFGVTREELGDEAFDKKRKNAKELFLGRIYGMGDGKVCKKLGLPTEFVKLYGEMREVAGPEGRKFIQEFNRKVPFLEDIKQKAQWAAKSRGWVQTLLGRHIHYVHGEGNERKALNNIIQGSAADQTKLAMVQIYEAGYKLQLQVHDECDTTVYNEKQIKDITEIMENCVELLVPTKVDVEIGDSWGNSMEKK